MTTSLSGSQRVTRGWLAWDVRIGMPIARVPVSLPGLGEIDFGSEVRTDEPSVRAALRTAHVHDAAFVADDSMEPSDHIVRVDVDGNEMWVVVMVSPGNDYDSCRERAVGLVDARRVVVADHDPEGRWWVGLLS